MRTFSITEFLRLEAAGGILLVAAAALALGVSNSPLASWYDALFALPVGFRVGDLDFTETVRHWVNDGLMAVFFLLVGLEIKREFREGALSSIQRAALPAVGAVGGMAVPTAIFLAFNAGTPTAQGWAIPAATDIAFAVGVLALLGNRVPASLKVFLLALAVLDDLGAILVIALFYAHDLSPPMLGGAGAVTLLLIVMNLGGMRSLGAYGLVGLVLWVLVLKSGIHATLAGVVLAFAVPLGNGGKHPQPGNGHNHGGHGHGGNGHGDNNHGGNHDSPLGRMEHGLHPWVTYGIVPLFAFANAGVSVAGLSLASLIEPLPLGIALGLFVGKQLGVMGFGWTAVRLGLCAPPEGASWWQFYGVAVVTGIGFTMSLFIGNLAFHSDEHDAAVRVGVLAGSILSAVVGFAVLRLVSAGEGGRATAGARQAG